MIVTNSLFSQKAKIISFSDAVYEKPVSGVMVFVDGNFVSVSDNNGNCQIDNNVNEIYCEYFGFKDTLVNIETCDQCVIILETNYNLLDVVEVEAKYNAKKHLLKLLNESQQTTNKLDTVLYYKFKEIKTIPELEQTEIFTGILKVKNKGHSGGGCIAFVSKIFNYYNSIEQDVYELMQSNSIVTMLNSDVLFPWTIKQIKKKNDVERTNFSTEDSLCFSILTKKDYVVMEFSYISFVNNKIKTRAFAGANHKNNGCNKYYFKMDYSKIPISIPEQIVFSREYVLKNGLTCNNYIELKKIENPNIEFDLNILLFNLNNKALIERAKTNFPDIVIPTELKEE